MARDPRSASELPAPLLPEEIAHVAQLSARAAETVAALEQYGLAIPGQYAGAFVDDGLAVIQFTGDVDQHRAALQRFLPGSRVDVRRAGYNLEELEGFRQAVTEHGTALEALGVKLDRVSVDIRENKVNLTYRAREPADEAVIREVGAPPWLLARRIGPLAWPGPFGSLRPRILDRQGRPVAATCFAGSVDASVAVQMLPISTNAMGVCDFGDRVPAVELLVEVSYDRGRETVEKSQTVHVPAGGSANDVIVAD